MSQMVLREGPERDLPGRGESGVRIGLLVGLLGLTGVALAGGVQAVAGALLGAVLPLLLVPTAGRFFEGVLAARARREDPAIDRLLPHFSESLRLLYLYRAAGFGDARSRAGLMLWFVLSAVIGGVGGLIAGLVSLSWTGLSWRGLEMVATGLVTGSTTPVLTPFVALGADPLLLLLGQRVREVVLTKGRFKVAGGIVGLAFVSTVLSASQPGPRSWGMYLAMLAACVGGAVGAGLLTSLLPALDPGRARIAWVPSQGRASAALRTGLFVVLALLPMAGIVSLCVLDPGTTTLKGHTKDVTCVAVAPGGKLAASGAKDSTVRLWDLEKRCQVGCLEGHTKPVRGLAFAPDGRALLSAGADGTVRLWDLATGKEAARFPVPWGEVLATAFSPDGSGVLGCGCDGHLWYWDRAS